MKKIALVLLMAGVMFMSAPAIADENLGKIYITKDMIIGGMEINANAYMNEIVLPPGAYVIINKLNTMPIAVTFFI